MELSSASDLSTRPLPAGHDGMPAAHIRWTPRPAVIVLATLGVLVARRPAAFYRPQFWAEDFTFLTTAEKLGVASFWTPQAGYLHLIPRAIAWPATFLDPLLQPSFFLAGAMAVLLAVLCSCLSPRLELPVKPWLAFAVVLVPHTGEVFFNPTNAQWIAALGLLLTIFKHDPERPREWAADLGFILFSGFSGPFVVLALPLFARRCCRRRTRASAILTASASIPAAVQAGFILFTPQPTYFVGPFSLLNLFAVTSFRLAGVFAGALLTPSAGRFLTLIVAGGMAAFLGGLAWRARDGQPASQTVSHRGDMGWLLVFAGLLLATAAARVRFDLWVFGDTYNGDRYFFIPEVILLWVAGMVLCRQPQRAMRWLGGVWLVCGLLANASRFEFHAYRDDQWYAACPAIRAGKTVQVTINPDWTYSYRRRS